MKKMLLAIPRPATQIAYGIKTLVSF